MAWTISLQLLYLGKEIAVAAADSQGSDLPIRERKDHGRVDNLLPGIGIVITLSMGI